MASTPDDFSENAFATMALHGAQRHVLLCVGPDCCATAEGLATWDWLKRRLKELGLPVLRTKAACLRICRGGPWLVVYPEGIWYGAVTIERCERIVVEHLQGGRPIAAWIAAEHPLGVPPAAEVLGGAGRNRTGA